MYVLYAACLSELNFPEAQKFLLLTYIQKWIVSMFPEPTIVPKSKWQRDFTKDKKERTVLYMWRNLVFFLSEKHSHLFIFTHLIQAHTHFFCLNSHTAYTNGSILLSFLWIKQLLDPRTGRTRSYKQLFKLMLLFLYKALLK